MESDRAERRREARHDIVGRARVRHAADVKTLDIVNVSRSGVLINLGRLKRPAWLEIEEKLALTMTTQAGPDVDVEGTIVRIVEDRRFRAFAVEFAALSSAAREGIERIVAEASRKAAPPPLPR